MYVPTAFRMEDLAQVREVVRQYPFGILVSVIEGEPFATHLPVLLESENAGDVLYAHVAKANPHWRAFGSPALVIFVGPHGYVSPSWYETRPNVPTWNYLAVHAHGTPVTLDDPEVASAHLRKMVATFDPHLGETHPESISEDAVNRLQNGVVVFKMPVTRWEGKAKLNQNRAEVDRLAVRERYRRSAIPDEQAMSGYMTEDLHRAH